MEVHAAAAGIDVNPAQHVPLHAAGTVLSVDKPEHERVRTWPLERE